MKTVADVVDAVQRRLRGTWHLTVAGNQEHWPYQFPLGRPDRTTVTSRFGEVQRWAFIWTDWADKRGLELVWEGRRSGSAHDMLPTHLVVPDADAAAALFSGWPQRLTQGRSRYAKLSALFPGAPIARVVLAVDGWTDTDIDLLVAATTWFGQHPCSGLSARQVPIEGLHSKWIARHGTQVLALSGLDHLGLVEPRATPVNFTYLDLDHLAAGGRRHDSIIPGDTATPSYLPRLVLITENKDSAILFPNLASGIAVQGGGKAGPGFVSHIHWIVEAPTLVYWGDMDAAGFEIVDMYRRNGVNVSTILMDLDTLSEYGRFAATADAKGRPLMREPRKPLVHLTDGEREAYEALTDPSREWPIRVEQERIPLAAAMEALLRHSLPREYVQPNVPASVAMR